MDLVTEKKIWSRNFWISKFLRLLIIILLSVLLTQLWNWQSQQDDTPVVTTDTQPTQQETPVVQEEPKEPVFPYEITLPAGTTGPVEGTEADKPSYTYTFSDGATLVVYPEGTTETPTDVTWRHTLDANNKLSVTDRVDSICAVGTLGCSAGNGVIEITSRPAEGSTNTFVVKITDSNIATKTVAQAAEQYEPIVESIKVNE